MAHVFAHDSRMYGRFASHSPRAAQSAQLAFSSTHASPASATATHRVRTTRSRSIVDLPDTTVIG